MGLAEKRIRQDLEDRVIPEAAREFKEICGGELTIDVDWESFADKESLQEIEHQVIGRVISEVRNICTDELARQAVSESFSRLQIKNLDSADGREILLQDKVLRMQTRWQNFSDIFAWDDIREAIESRL